MSVESEKIIIDSSNIFEFTNPACECDIDVTHPTRGETEHILRLYPIANEFVRFAYTAENGLIRLNKTGAIDSKPVLTELLAIPENNVNVLKGFIEKFGFFLPLSNIENNSINADVLFALIARVKATVLLMSALGEPQINHARILGLTVYLLLENPVELMFPNYETPFETCPHDMSRVWNGVYPTKEIPYNEETDGYDGHVNGAYRVEDKIYPPTTLLDYEDYHSIFNTFDNSIDLSSFSNNVIYLYRNAVGVGDDCRYALDFFYHFYKKVGKITCWNYKGDLWFKEENTTIIEKFNKNFDDVMKNALIKLAKATLKNELEYNLNWVTPSYNTETMSPSWQIGHLFSGLCFSVFYMRPNVALYRRCGNPNCDRSFLVKTTSAKQKYCDPACANSMAQRNHRRKIKEKHTTKPPIPAL